MNTAGKFRRREKASAKVEAREISFQLKAARLEFPSRSLASDVHKAMFFSVSHSPPPQLINLNY
jgi:hypothetical protein